MLKQKRTKMSRNRGSSSHGWGHKKKHRGSGHRGGFGLAGTGARGDSQKAGLLSSSKRMLRKVAARRGIKLSNVVAGNDYFGKKGFISIHKKKLNVLSISYIEDNFDQLVESGMIVQEGKEYIFDSTVVGYNKILGRGNFTKKLKVICFDISESAKVKIEAAGGSVEVLGAQEEVVDEAPAKEASQE